jgi:hypothetical protein
MVNARNLRSISLRRLFSLLIDGGFRQFGQRLVRFLLFLQSFVEKAYGLLQSKLLGPCL